MAMEPQIPLSSLQNGADGETPEDLLRSLRSLKDVQLSNKENSRRVPTDKWIETADGLSFHFIAAFPTFSSFPWSELSEKAALADVTLKIICRAAENVVDFLCLLNGFVERLLSRILDMCFRLETWIDVPAPPNSAAPTPKLLRANAFLTAVSLLQSIGCRLHIAESLKIPSWELLRNVVNKLFSASRGMYSVLL